MNRYLQRTTVTFALLLVLVTPGVEYARAQEPVLVKDINTVLSGSSPSEFVEINGVAFFAAIDFLHGRELWRTDGTEAGTFRVKDIVPGPDWSSPREFTVLNGTLFFVANDAPNGSIGIELWKTDGSESGTTLVKDIVTGPGHSSPNGLTAIGGILFFAANSDNSGRELWRTDGTESGTIMVRDIAPGALGSSPLELADVDGTLFFSADDAGFLRRELWKSDGTTAGTVVVRNIAPVSGRSSTPQELTNVDGTLFFSADDGSSVRRELWKSNGTSTGTILVRNIASQSNRSSSPRELTAMEGLGVLYFSADDSSSTRRELWRSDGTFGGTFLVRDIWPGSGSSSPTALTNIDGVLYFSADDGGSTRRELWRSGGTGASTFIVRDISPGAGSSVPRSLLAMNGQLFFVADDGVSGLELWTSDGTTAGTALVAEILTGPGSAFSCLITCSVSTLGDTLIFPANDGTNGFEPWRSDGTAAGTSLISNLRDDTDNSNPSHLTVIGDTAYFAAFEPTTGEELWKTDGSEAGTVLVRDIAPGIESSSPRELAGFNGTLFFAADDQGPTGLELWRSDGQSDGTTLVKDMRPGSSGSNPHGFIDIDGTLFFSADSALWKSDGTSAGTVQVAPGGPSLPSRLTNVVGTLFFNAREPATGNELWKSDGTSSGTVLVKDIFVGSFGSNPNHLVDMGGILFFTAFEPSTGFELWRSDGTADGTSLVIDGIPGSQSLSPGGLTIVDGTLFFRSHPSSSIRQLWRSDGTELGTFPLPASSPPGIQILQDLTAANGQVFFTMDDGVNGMELWRSDGTELGTHLVRDIFPGPFGSTPFNLKTVDGTMYFMANDGTTGHELWTSDGTSEGTSQLADIQPGPAGSGPRDFVKLGADVLFSAVTFPTGRELWSLDVSGATSPGEDVVVAPVDPTTGESTVSLGFEEVTGTGNTTVETQTQGPPPPEGFKIGNNAYINIETTAEFSGLVQVCFDYSGFKVNENNLQLRHFVAIGEPLTRGGFCDSTSSDFSNAAQGCWEDVTQQSPIPIGVGFQNEGQPNPDTADDIICGLTATLSPFILVEALQIAGPGDPVALGSEVQVSVDLTDSEPVDSLVWDWGDGTVEEIPASSPPGVETATHTYSEPNVYVVRVTLKNDGVDVGVAALRYVVVFDPDGGFVTGGGWILSPAGAFSEDATLYGKATFGFVSKYKRGANVPTGNTEFRFKAAALNFKSVAYEWLVIAGTKAQFKGVGTINDQGNFGFLLTATDEAAGADTFRLKIWDRDAGDAVVYDNGAQQPIAQGSIVIHSGK